MLTITSVAAFEGHVDVCRFLKEHGAEPEQRNEIGYTALHGAIKQGNQDVIDFLLGITNINIAGKDGITCLHMAAETGNFGLVKCLVSRGSNVNAITTVDEYTPLLMATNRQHEVCKVQKTLKYLQQICEYLVHNKAVLSMANKLGNTPLQFV